MTGWPLIPAALALLGFCVAAETLQQLSFKVGAARAEAAPRFARAIVLEPLVWVGLLIWAVESIAWVHVLERAPLTMAYPVMTLTYATVPLAGLLFLKERMTRRQMAGAGLIFGGVVLVAVAGA